jgi:adenine-specific DNA-methyltransferase
MKDDPKQKLRILLKQLFQFENENLDFGIYRILNHNKERLRRFIENDLVADIEQRLSSAAKQNIFPISVSDDIMSEICNHLIHFFSRYYQQGDFIPRRRYGRENKYVIPHSGEELIFYWMNKEQYYVKSNEFFDNYSFRVDDFTIHFRLVNAEIEKGNIKAHQKKFFLLSSPSFEKSENQLTIFFDYRSLNFEEKNEFGKGAKQSSVNDILIEYLRSKLANDHRLQRFFAPAQNGSGLTYHLSRFTRRQNKDYFIHKNLGSFLRRELDFYLTNEVLVFENLSRMEAKTLFLLLLKARTVQEIGQKIIAFLEQIENFQKKIWEKKSFVLSTDYVITLDKIRQFAGESFLEQIIPEILTNRKQLRDWQENFKFKPTAAEMLANLFPLSQKRWQQLPIDTAYFDEAFKWKLLNALGREGQLDEQLDGILIHSENWQSLNLLRRKFSNRIQTIYIDPPFNKEQEADYFYKVGYKDSTWNTLLVNRISAARNLINNTGCIFVRCDYNGSMYVRLLLNEIFGRENFRNELVINRTLARQTVGRQFAIQTESLFLFSKSEKFTPRAIERPTEPKWYPLLHFPRKDERPRKVLGKTFYPPKKRRWALSQEKIDQLAARGKIRINENLRYVDFRGEEIIGVPELLYDSENVGNEWLDIPGYAQRHRFPTENAEALLKRVIESSSRPGEWVMDFFLGSGTAIAMAQKMKRKWIGIEIGGHFHSVILPRIKKVLFGDKSKISKEVGWKGGGFFKYHSLEQFEDALENIRFRDIPDPPVNTDHFAVKYLLDYKTNGSPIFLDISRLDDPFNYRMKILHNYRQQECRVDLVETFNYLTGISVERILHTHLDNRRYVFVFGVIDSEKSVVVWRATGNLDFAADRDFIQKTMSGFAPQKLYVNGDCAVEGIINIENEMRERMMENTDQ